VPIADPAARGFEVAADLYDARRRSCPDLPLPGWVPSSGSKNPVGLVDLGTETREADSPACPEEAMLERSNVVLRSTPWTAGSLGRALDIGPAPDEPPLQLRDGLAEVLPPGHEGVGRREAGCGGVVRAFSCVSSVHHAGSRAGGSVSHTRRWRAVTTVLRESALCGTSRRE
jgi:hypothetical protein